MRKILPQRAQRFLFITKLKIKFAKLSQHKALRPETSGLLFFLQTALIKPLRALRLILYYSQGKINLILAIKITVPKTIFNVLFEKEPLP
jgi:hypothetical protein